MAISNDLALMFAKATKTTQAKDENKAITGTVVVRDGQKYVRMDGSELLTPVQTTSTIDDGDRVKVEVAEHKATVVGNFTSPSVGENVTNEINNRVTNIGILVAEKASIQSLEVERARITNLEVTKLDTVDFTAEKAEVRTLLAEKAEIEDLEAESARITTLETTKLDAEVAEITYAAITDLEAETARINALNADYGAFKMVSTTALNALEANVGSLDTRVLTAEDLIADKADLNFANVNFFNVDMAKMGEFFARAGIIDDIIVGDQTLTGELVGVTIKGDLIEGNTVKADKLVVRGEDGLYYKLNVSAETVESQQTEYNSLNGSMILANTITASKIAVDDLVAFEATIGGFHIDDHNIHSGVKTSVHNTTKGVYMDDSGQMAIGDGNAYVKYYYDETDQKNKLEISADEFRYGASRKTIDGAIREITDDIITDMEIGATNLLNDSEYGFCFKIVGDDVINYVLDEDGELLRDTVGDYLYS